MYLHHINSISFQSFEIFSINNSGTLTELLRYIMIDVKGQPVIPLIMTFNWIFESSTQTIRQRRTVFGGENKHSFPEGAKAQRKVISITLILWLLSFGLK